MASIDLDLTDITDVNVNTKLKDLLRERKLRRDSSSSKVTSVAPDFILLDSTSPTIKGPSLISTNVEGGSDSSGKRKAVVEEFLSLNHVEGVVGVDKKRKRDDVKGMRKDPLKDWAKFPWQGQNYSANTAIALHEEIRDFIKYIDPTPEEIAMRQEVVRRIANVVYSLWPQAKVEVFGSMAAELFLPTSDIDIMVVGKWPNSPLRTLAEALERQKIPSSIKVIDARVPIIKLRDALTSVDIDISYNVPDGPKNSILMKGYINDYPALRPLTLIIKQFLAQRALNEVFLGGLGSYTILLMTLSFLQLHPRGHAKHNKSSNLGVLLLEFFELYGINFNYYNTAISVQKGGRYHNKHDLGWFNPQRPGLLAIENPQSPDDDVSKNSYNMLQVRQSFEHAFHVLSSSFHEHSSSSTYWKTRGTVLSRIIRVPQEIVEYRKMIKENWNTSTLVKGQQKSTAAELVLPSFSLSAHATETVAKKHKPR